MEEVQIALRLAKMGKPLTALNFVKQFLKNNPSLISETEECRNFTSVILHFPSLNDESWRYFVHMEKEEVLRMIEKIGECLNVP